MNKLILRFALIAFMLFSGSQLVMSQDTRYEDLIVRTPGFAVSKQLESIKNQSNGTNGLNFIAYYQIPELFHFRIDRQQQPDNSLIYTLFQDINFTLINDQEEVKKMISEVSHSKTDISIPVLKNE